MDWPVGPARRVSDPPGALPNVKVGIMLMQPQLSQEEGVHRRADGDQSDLTFDLLAKLILHLKGGLEDTKCVDMVPIRRDDNGCFVIKRLQGQGCGSVPVDEVGKSHGVDTPMDQTQPANRVKVNVSLQDP